MSQSQGPQAWATSALLFPQEAESRPRCRRLQLKDMIPTEMQRLTKYPLLLQSIGQNTGTPAGCPAGPMLPVPPWPQTSSSQGWGSPRLVSPLPTEEPAEREKVEQAAECCREILHHVNQAVRDMEDLLVSLGTALRPRQWDMCGQGSACPSQGPLLLWSSSLALSLSPSGLSRDLLGPQLLPLRVTGGQAWPLACPYDTLFPTLAAQGLSEAPGLVPPKAEQ